MNETEIKNQSDQTIISDELRAKLNRRAHRLWDFSKTRQKHPFTKWLIEENLSTLISNNNLGFITSHVIGLISKHKNVDILLCRLGADDRSIYLSVYDSSNGKRLGQKTINRGWAKIGDLDFYSVKIRVEDTVEQEIIFTGKNLRESVMEDVEQDHFILFCYEED